MDSLIGHILQRPSPSSPQFDLLPLKTQIGILKQQNSEMKKSISDQQRAIVRHTKDKKILSDKVFKLQNKCASLMSEIESLELAIAQLTNKIGGAGEAEATAASTLRLNIITDPQKTTNYSNKPKSRLSSLPSQQSVGKKEPGAKTNHLRVPKVSLQPGSQLSDYSDRSHVKVISSSNKKIILDDDNDKGLKTLKSIRSDSNLQQYLLQKSTVKVHYVNEEKINSPTKKMNYLEKLRLEEELNLDVE